MNSGPPNSGPIDRQWLKCTPEAKWKSLPSWKTGRGLFQRLSFKSGTLVSESQPNNCKPFDSFHQLDSGLSRSYSGLGLGLALSEKIVSLMMGRFGPKARLAREARSPSGYRSTCEDNARSAQAVGQLVEARLLVVEDDEVARRVVSHILSA